MLIAGLRHTSIVAISCLLDSSFGPLEKLQGETYIACRCLSSWVCCLHCVWEGAGRVNAPGLCRRHRGRAVQDRRETLMAACQVAGISAAGLLLPCSLIDMAFDT